MSRQPLLRHVEVYPVEQDGRRSFALRDPTGLAPNTIVVSPAVAFILQRFDGRHDLEAIQAELLAAADESVPMEQLENLVRSLDEAHFLAGPAFDEHARGVLAAYRSAPFRSPSHAGQAYPERPEELTRWFDDLLIEDDPGGSAEASCVGLAVPHIDLRFGGASCKLGHRQMHARSGELDTVVVLGTGHCAGEELYTLTRQDYGTPLGAVSTDGELVEALVGRLGEERLLGAELLHAQEHSIEFQSLFMRLHQQNGDPPLRLLPVLVGSFHGFIESRTEPFRDDRVRGFVAALNEEVARLGRRVSYVASIDLAHQGPRYGDAAGLSEEQAARVEQEDRELLKFAENGDPEGFFAHNLEARDWRRVCGFSALYTLLRLLPDAKGRLLDYTQTTFPDTADTVSHCTMVFEQRVFEQRVFEQRVFEQSG